MKDPNYAAVLEASRTMLEAEGELGLLLNLYKEVILFNQDNCGEYQDLEDRVVESIFTAAGGGSCEACGKAY